MNENILVETYIRLKKKFFSKAYLILNNREDANDALQEAFYKLWKRVLKIILLSLQEN